MFGLLGRVVFSFYFKSWGEGLGEFLVINDSFLDWLFLVRNVVIYLYVFIFNYNYILYMVYNIIF